MGKELPAVFNRALKNPHEPEKPSALAEACRHITNLARGFVDLTKRIAAVEAHSPIAGPQGEKGDIGPPGLVGEIGPQGARGLQGPVGNDGKPGTDGKNGLDGKDGINGQDGKPGIEGRAGDRGEPGPQGPQGLEGPKGLQGDRGLSGPQGPQGEKGERGEKGEPGDVAQLGFAPDDIADLISEVLMLTAQTPKGIASKMSAPVINITNILPEVPKPMNKIIRSVRDKDGTLNTTVTEKPNDED